jgi:hypothetical protein
MKQKFFTLALSLLLAACASAPKSKDSCCKDGGCSDGKSVASSHKAPVKKAAPAEAPKAQ